MSYKLTVENIKCGGCASTITNKLNKIEGVSSSEVDVENGIITITAEQSTKAEAAQLLLKIGYPETGTADGLKAAKAKAKSFVSCAVGKMSS